MAKDIRRNPIGPVFPCKPNSGTEIRISNIIRETIPSYFLHETKPEWISRSEIERFWNLFWTLNSAHSVVPVMERSSCDALFKVFLFQNFSSENGPDLLLMDVAVGTAPVVKSIVFSTVALTAQCHGYEASAGFYFKLARGALDLVTNRRVFEYLLATMLLVRCVSSRL